MAAALCGTAAMAQNVPAVQNTNTVEGVTVSDVKIERNGEYLAVDMLLNMQELEVDGNRAVLLTPRLANGSDSLDLPSVGIYGRRRYYLYVRNGKSSLTGKEAFCYKASDKPESLEYNKLVPYRDWMSGASLTLHRSDYGCCNTLLASQEGILGHHAEAVEAVAFLPELVYVVPQAESVKSRSLEGSAYIDFPVNKTVIYPDYRRNTVELGKIQATIDSVRNDNDITITQVWLKGYASPEGTYASNRKLAISRTDALKSHIQQLYKFAEGVIATDFEPEDWAGLRRYVEQSNIDHKTEILVLIDSDREPDNKEWAIKKNYPEEYRILLQHCYPALRHTDYRIAYDIRSYSDVKEIMKVMAMHPQKLSLNEFYVAAQAYEAGSDEFAEIFETAVRMYPADQTANLNAANAAMLRGDNAAAERYLAKAGDTPEAEYARGSLAARKGDYAAARSHMVKARDMGMAQAAAALEEMDKYMKTNL